MDGNSSNGMEISLLKEGENSAADASRGMIMGGEPGDGRL